MKRQSVHLFELRQFSDLSRHMKEPQNGDEADDPETLFHIRSNLLCLLCWCVVSFLYALRLYFSLLENMICSVSGTVCLSWQQLLRVGEFCEWSIRQTSQFKNWFSFNSWVSVCLSVYLCQVNIYSALTILLTWIVIQIAFNSKCNSMFPGSFQIIFKIRNLILI